MVYLKNSCLLIEWFVERRNWKYDSVSFCGILKRSVNIASSRKIKVGSTGGETELKTLQKISGWYARGRHIRNKKKTRKVIYPDVPTDRDVQRTSEQIPLRFFFSLRVHPLRTYMQTIFVMFLAQYAPYEHTPRIFCNVFSSVSPPVESTLALANAHETASL